MKLAAEMRCINPSARIHELLRAKNITAACIARDLNLSRYAVSGVINGDFDAPRVREAISKILGVETEDLWTDIKARAKWRRRSSIPKITHLLHDAGIKVIDVAAQLGISLSSVTRVITGKQKNDRVSKAIADALGMKVTDIWPNNKKDSGRAA